MEQRSWWDKYATINPMKKNLIEFIKHPTSLHVIINTVGNYLNVFFSLFFILILARALTKPELGVFNVLFGLAYVLANILEFGTTATIYSYLPPLLNDKRENLYKFIKSTFYYQSFFASIVIVILFFAFPWLDKVFFKTDAPNWQLYLTAISVLLFIWQNFITNILFAAKKFVHANIYLNISNVFKTLGIFALMATKTVSIGSIIFLLGIVGPLVFFILLFIQKKDLIFVLLKAEVKMDTFRFDYAFTYFIASQFYNLGLRMDLFLLSFYNLKAEAGEYGLAQKIILSIITIIVSITQVISPGFSTAHTKTEIRAQFKAAFLYLLIPSAIFVALFFTPEIIFTIVFTKELKNITEISHQLSLPFVLASLGSAPMLFLLYTVKKPAYILWTNILFFLIITIGSYYLIPQRGMFGPPVAIAIAYVVTIGLQTLAAYTEYKKLPGR